MRGFSATESSKWRNSARKIAFWVIEDAGERPWRDGAFGLEIKAGLPREVLEKFEPDKLHVSKNCPFWPGGSFGEHVCMTSEIQAVERPWTKNLNDSPAYVTRFAIIKPDSGRVSAHTNPR